MILRGVANPRSFPLPAPPRTDINPASDSACGWFPSRSLRPNPLSSPFFRFCSDSGRSRGVRSRLQVSLENSPSSDDAKAGPAFTEEYKSTRQSPDAVREEILDCYKLIDRLGRGAVYCGSARTSVGHPHYLQAKELAHEVALLLKCTSWTGAGPGLMDAVMQGAIEANHPVGGFRIASEGGVWVQSSVHPYLTNETYFTCRFFSARKHGLVEAAVRNSSTDRTAFVCLPGGLGTLDEIFEILTLTQLHRLGSPFPVPLLLLNYDGFYTHLLRFIATCQDWGSVSPGEFENICCVCSSNLDALEHLADFYGVAEEDRGFRARLKEWK